jgi:class 3 adenylate cyclase
MTAGLVDRLRTMEELPDGVVTFLFTDVEGSTRLWEDAPNSMMEALRLHDEGDRIRRRSP